MRYRLTVVTVIVAAIVAAAVLIALPKEEDPPIERDQNQTKLVPPELGIVGAITATAEAGGTALDPTALVTPTTLVDDPSSTSTPTTPQGERPGPLLSTVSGLVAAGDTISIQLTGAAPTELFEILINGESVLASGSADATGSAVIAGTIPDGLPAGTVAISFSGEISGSTAISIEISVAAPVMTISPDLPAVGDLITISAEGLSPGEAVMIRASGQLIASATTGVDGSFSVTAELPDLEEGEHSVLMEGEFGETATTDLTVVAPLAPAIAEPTATSSASGAGAADLNPDETGNASGGEPGSPGGPDQPSQVDQSGDAGEPVKDEDIDPAVASADSGLPNWLYVVIGVFAGWLGLLTVWVIRLDRSKDSGNRALALEIAKLVEMGQTATRPDQNMTPDIPVIPDREDRVA